MTTRPHGAQPRGLDNTPRTVSYDGRFGRLFRTLPAAQDPSDPSDDQGLRELAAAMRGGPDDTVGDNPNLPAGYTYLGQFIDHDLTFDPASSLQRRNDPEGLLDFRSPRFDLDSIYGSGPDDEPFQYDQHLAGGLGMLIERRGPSPDLPRNSQGRALTGDPRNDENVMVSQLHVAFLSLHNVVLAQQQAAGLSGRELFAETQRTVQWHYQWVVVHDYLRRILDDDTFTQLLVATPAVPAGPSADTPEDTQLRESARLRIYRHKRNPYLPVEFSVAAYRFGHSQVRDRYAINNTFVDLPAFSPGGGRGSDFSGFDTLLPGWHVSWPRFFEFPGQGVPQHSRLIDTLLSPSLSHLPEAGEMADLALRNLRRGAALGLPSGQAVATALGLTPLSDADLAPAPPGRAPLWFYVLREAERGAGGRHLGPVGGRIVGETLLGLLRADPQSYLSQQPTWQPTLPTRSGNPRAFDMVDLLALAVPDQCRPF